MDEPAADSAIVELLEALPPEERDYYSCEDHVIDWTGKSRELFEEIQEQYSFVGGEYSQYVAYFARDDLPPQMWHFVEERQVKAVAGFSVVPTKNSRDQRKLFMQCSTNFAWTSGKLRSDHGLLEEPRCRPAMLRLTCGRCRSAMSPLLSPV